MPIPEALVKRIQEKYAEVARRSLSPFACPNSLGARQIDEPPSYRPVFVRDGDRIIHSLAYARYFDKTQVFFWIRSDLHSHRMLHVQLVSKLGRVVANTLGLNPDLVEAIALGHDIGHPPFGHDGERILSQICEEHNIGRYLHNCGSSWFLQEVEHQNLTLPVLDGILGHNGEMHHQKIDFNDFKGLSWDKYDEEQNGLVQGTLTDLSPKTLEGILIRFIDVVSYISRDILDAEHLGITSFSQIPGNVKRLLGDSNREIIDSLISDLIVTSYEQPFIGYSDDIFSALSELYEFNKEHIYAHSEKERYLPIIEQAFRTLWDHYYNDIIARNTTSKIYSDHIDLNLRMISDRYPHIRNYESYAYLQNPPEVIVRDFIAGMTDQYFWELVQKIDPSIKFQRKKVY